MFIARFSFDFIALNVAFGLIVGIVHHVVMSF